MKQIAKPFIRTVFTVNDDGNLAEMYEIEPGIYSYQRVGTFHFQLDPGQPVFETALEGLQALLAIHTDRRDIALRQLNVKIEEIEEKIRICGGTVHKPKPKETVITDATILNDEDHTKKTITNARLLAGAGLSETEIRASEGNSDHL